MKIKIFIINFEDSKRETIENMKIIPETYDVIKKLKERNIKIGSTTGFDKEQMERLKIY